MTRKRFIKLCMGCGHCRRNAELLAHNARRMGLPYALASKVSFFPDVRSDLDLFLFCLFNDILLTKDLTDFYKIVSVMRFDILAVQARKKRLRRQTVLIADEFAAAKQAERLQVPK